MTIEQRIIAELGRLNNADPTLHSKALTLHTAVEKIIHQLKAHLGEISTQMKEYDKHDASHSEKVLENIEKLLRNGGIERLSLLEAMTLRLCCYFHDSGMILPECYLPLLEDIEWDSRAELPDDLQPWLKENRKTYDVVQDQFYCPDSEEGYEEFLTDELDRYQKYRLGLPEDISGEAHFRRTRHDYLRHTHGERAKRYAENLTHFLEGIPYGGRSDLAEAVGLICASHCQEITEVRKLETCLEIIDSCPDMACNVRYLAMLLRLGDVIHFSSDRASRTAYAERAVMDADSEIHWKTKFEELEYAIRPREKGVSISYSGCFEDPKAYYFLQSHLDRVDEELRNYAAFVSDMHGEPDADRYSLGLPTNVVRDAIRTSRFTPDPELKFKLEHRKIITLLMGMQLYRDEFMCLRELYQNALDACRCMWAENKQKRLSGDLKIEFGLDHDKGGDYLYCKDEGTGMTMDIVKNYLLRIGNSYYQSDEFRRSNAQWGDAVAPVSEFGIGLLSCYMIASRIEVITRHHTLPGTPPIWVCMEDSDDYGYFRTPGRTQEKQVGLHGTYVKLYLKKEYKQRATDFIPEDPMDAVFMLDHYDPKEDVGVTSKAKEFLEHFKNSLYHQIQQFIHVPDSRIPVWVQGEAQRVKLFCADKSYSIAAKLPILKELGFEAAKLVWGENNILSPRMFGKEIIGLNNPIFDDVFCQWIDCFSIYYCETYDELSGSSVSTMIHLPRKASVDYSSNIYAEMDFRISNPKFRMYIDGMPAHIADRENRPNSAGISFYFNGKPRPQLTVDRDVIRKIPTSVKEIQTALQRKLCDNLVNQILDHFSKYPEARTKSALEYMFSYLFEKYDGPFAVDLLRRLSTDLFRDHCYFGIPLSDWFYRNTIKINPTLPQAEGGYCSDLLFYHALDAAEEIRIENDEVFIQTTISAVPMDYFELRISRQVIRTDNWPDKFWQYDAVRKFTGFVPDRVFRLLERCTNTSLRLINMDYTFPSVWDMQHMYDPVELQGISWQSAISCLRASPGISKIHNCDYCDPFIKKGNKRYILYFFVNPTTLSTDEEELLEAICTLFPPYREGVEKGWSILFYNYKNGYVIAPGIVDREDMLKLLPDEARNHDDGLEYYFTDGTKAF